MKNQDLDTPEVKNGNYQRQSVPWWFVILSIAVVVFCSYYIYRFWGGLGPGIPQ